MYGTLAKRIDTLDANEMPDHDDEMYYKPFKYLHLGTLAYIGNSYVFFLPPLPSSFFLLYPSSLSPSSLRSTDSFPYDRS